ncbi:hypothetical protein J2793_006216 [Paraburkholderia caledonica]|uniref:Uncharacterized protein n=1 Tax=Paraburkholderia caledonica TaxID=134536 RepID=A0AB73IMY8_9BURK|nr:hypothetical protein [Paraburkholderia caledonica]
MGSKMGAVSTADQCVNDAKSKFSMLEMRALPDFVTFEAE